ncbi:MAG TPA: hypothetical protein VGE21_09315 [Flavobacteriales bacterium]
MSPLLRSLLLGALLLPLVVCAQEYDTHLRYEFIKANGKPKFLKPYRQITLHLKDSLPAIEGVTHEHRVIGMLQFTTPDSISVWLASEHWSESIHENYLYPPIKGKDITCFTNDTVNVPRTYALGRIDHIRYDPSTAGMGQVITLFSAIGLLIYAPLKAMRFRDGTFNSDRYLRVATPCVIGIGVGLLIIPFTEPGKHLQVKLGT